MAFLSSKRNIFISFKIVHLIQFVIEKITGKTLNELMKEKLFGPLGMKNSSYTWQPEYEMN
jgi:CubicO group peptidase (beta-lactamase class C family)